MTMERPDESEVLEGAAKFNDERADAFLDREEKERIWAYVAAETGISWHSMERVDKERMVQRYTKNIVREVMEMSGGLWGKLSPFEKRQLFHARFIDKNVAPADRAEAFSEPKAAEPFPSPDIWKLKNKDMLYGMTEEEKTQLYKRAYTKHTKEALGTK